MSCQFVKQKELAKTSINSSCWLQVVFFGLFKGWVVGKYKHLQTALAIVQVLGFRPEWCRIAKGRCRVFQGTECLDEREMDSFHPGWESWYTSFFLSGLVWNCGPLSTLPCVRNTYSFWKHQFNGLVWNQEPSRNSEPSRPKSNVKSCWNESALNSRESWESQYAVGWWTASKPYVLYKNHDDW